MARRGNADYATISVKVDKPTKKAIRIAAAYNDSNMSDWLRHAVHQKLKDDETFDGEIKMVVTEAAPAESESESTD